MSITPEDLFLYSKELKKDSEVSGSEMARRAAASKAYYSLFHTAMHYSSKVCQVSPKAFAGSTHSGLSQSFKDAAARHPEVSGDLRKIAIMLADCHRKRCEADYELAEDFSPEYMERHFKACEACLEVVASLGEHDSFASNG